MSDERTESPPPRLPPRIEERRLLDIAEDWMAQRSASGLRVAGLSTGRGQACEAIAHRFPDASVHLWFIDLYACQMASKQISGEVTGLAEEVTAVAGGETGEPGGAIREPGSATGVAGGGAPPNLHIACTADLEPRELDVALFPLGSSGEQELMRDYLQQLYDALRIGGWLIVSVDNPQDRWVMELLKSYEKSVRLRPFEDATVYLIEKTHALKKRKDFSCELAYRDCDELIRLVTRPGVFSHRQLDNGARQLLDAVDVYPEARLIDIGCGSGSVALGLAKRDASATVHAVDSNARGLWCVQRGMELNGIENITCELNATGDYRDPGTFDMALANPPYFGNYLIAEKFVLAAHRSLRPGGRLVLVTKQPKWYAENLPRWFHDCEVFESRRYHIASGVK
jgi:16S rRNA (guanine1207-N2)-methyltransferase